jgi:carboxymethylenebutenolidase
MTRSHVLAGVHAAIDHLRAGGRVPVGMVDLSIGGHVAYLAATELDFGCTCSSRRA